MTFPKNQRCAGHVRVNTARARKAAKTQREPIEAYILVRTSEGWTYAGTHKDVDHPDCLLIRPALRCLLIDVLAKNVDCVVVLTIDRLARFDDDLAELLAEFGRHSVSLVVPT
jgi:DNA invertase Pin-like site-specific DNA recombinase